MKNEIVKKEVTLTSAQVFKNELVLELEKASKEIGQKITEYGMKCVVNAISNLLTFCRTNQIDTKELDPVMLRVQIQNIAFTELNFATNPAEAYIDARKITVLDKEGKEAQAYSITFKPQGAGNEKLVRKYGVNVKELYAPWLIREGDEYTLGSFEDDKYTPPSFKPKSLSGKVIMVVYKVRKTDGTFEYLMADRESVKQNLIAQIRQNAMNKFYEWKTKQNGYKYKVIDYEKRDAFYAEVERDFEGKSVDECINLEKYKEYINPTYTSGGSKESMIIRKMRNNALKNYPKEYDNSEQAKAVEAMFEDRDDTVFEVKKPDVIDNVEDNSNNVDPKALPDFNVDSDGVVIDNKEEEKPEPKEEKEQPKANNASEGEVNPDEDF